MRFEGLKGENAEDKSSASCAIHLEFMPTGEFIRSEQNSLPRALPGSEVRQKRLTHLDALLSLEIASRTGKGSWPQRWGSSSKAAC